MSEPERGTAVLPARTWRPPPAGLVRTRLVERLMHPGAPSLAAVVAPGGCGKTTLLAQAATTARTPVAWLTGDLALRDPAALLAHLRLACAPLLPDDAAPWDSPDAALVALHQPGPPGLLVLDELQALDGSAGGDLVELVLHHQPTRLRVLVGSRTTPATVLPRRLAGTATQLGAEDLRFRTWEVAELFRTHHGTHLRAEEVADLTHRTSGWAAGLELFHLATRGQPASRRGRLLLGAGGGELTGDYLAHHVLAQVPAPTRTFLVASSVLGELTATSCDELLGTTDAAEHLDAAHRLGVLTTVLDGDGTRYRCHDVLRAHLLDALAAREGRTRERELHRRAAELSLRAGWYDEALRSYCRAEDWDNARQVLLVGGGTLAGRPGTWIDMLPPAIRSTDPWVGLALARRLVVDGALDDAVAAYRSAAERAQTPHGRATVLRELHAVQTWLAPPLGSIQDWVALARAALVAPREVLRREHPTDPDAALALALAELVAGDLATSTRRFTDIAESPHVEPVVEAVALLGRATGLSLTWHPDAPDARECARTAAKLLAAPALERLADGLDLACGPHPDLAGLTHLAERADAVGDRWGAALLGLFRLCAGLPQRRVTPGDVAQVEMRLRSLQAPALTAWTTSLALVVDAQHHPTDPARTAPPHRPAPRPRTPAPPAGTPTGTVPHVLTALAVATTPGATGRTAALHLADSTGGWVRALARTLVPTDPHAPAPTEPARENGPAPGTRPSGPGVPTEPVAVVTTHATTAHDAFGPAAGRLVVRCLGSFALERDGTPVPVHHLRPQHQELLRALCVHAGSTVHRDTLIEWFWPGRDLERAQHSLQVAVSELRRLLEPTPGRGRTSVLRRDTAGYGLHLEPGDEHDVRALELALRDARAAVAREDRDHACARYEAAIEAYTADLLPADTVRDWVAHERDRLREAVAGACHALADLHAGAGRQDDAVRVCRRGLALDPYQDGLWQRLVRALDADGRPAAAAAARREYAAVLRELDVPEPSPVAAASGAPALAAQAVMRAAVPTLVGRARGGAPA